MSREEQLEKKMCLAFFAKAKEKYPQASFKELIDYSMKFYESYMKKNPDKKGKIAIYDYNIIRYAAEDMYYQLVTIDNGKFEDKVKEIKETTKVAENDALELIGGILLEKNNLYDKLLDTHKEKMEKAKKLNVAYKELKKEHESLKEEFKNKMAKAKKLKEAYDKLKASK